MKICLKKEKAYDEFAKGAQFVFSTTASRKRGLQKKIRVSYGELEKGCFTFFFALR